MKECAKTVIRIVGMIGAVMTLTLKVWLLQYQEGGIDKNGEVRNNSMDPDKIQASSTNTQIEVVNKNMLIQEKNESVCLYSDNKNVDDRACQNNESGIVHFQEYGDKKNGERRSNSMYGSRCGSNLIHKYQMQNSR